MGSAVLTYRHEDGTNFCRILDDLIVGSCLQRVEDLDRRAAAASCGSNWGLGMGLGMACLACRLLGGAPCVCVFTCSTAPLALCPVSPSACPQGCGRGGRAHRDVPAGGL